jgi:thiamine-phosphate pyrophosphorylase
LNKAYILIVLLYYITERAQFPGDETARRHKLLDNIADAARWGVDYIQLREKDLSTRELEELARAAVKAVRKNSSTTRLLINSRIDVAIAANADGVNLRSGSTDLPASEARVIFHKAEIATPVIASSCHTLEQVAEAEAHGADFAVFGPVFEKVGTHIAPLGIEALRKVCARENAASSRMPVLALGGINLPNASACVNAGAAGIAAIRLFQSQSDDLGKIITELRRLYPQTHPRVAAATAKRRHPYQPG